MSLNQQYMTTGEAASYLGVSFSAIRFRIKTGVLRAEKVGSFTLVVRADVEQLARKRLQGD